MNSGFKDLQASTATLCSSMHRFLIKEYNIVRSKRDLPLFYQLKAHQNRNIVEKSKRVDDHVLLFSV
jgi:hypothetical protein